MERHGLACRVCVAAVLAVAVLLPCAAEEPGAVLATLIRGARLPSPPLLGDAQLDEAAGLYARDLSLRGVLDHTGREGERVAGRVRAAGCTDARVGEVLGAGADPRAVVASWLASPAHRAVLLEERWTHVGIGAAGAGDIGVFVVIFARRAVEGLGLSRTPERETVLTGRFVSGEAASPFLIVDLDRRAPLRFSAETGEFCFAFEPAWLAESYVRLGFVTASGAIVVTNVLHARARLALPAD